MLNAKIVVCLFFPLLLGSLQLLGANDMTDVSVDKVAALVDASNDHDVDRIMSFFAEDCDILMPRGPDSWGLRYEGIHELRKGLASQFEGVPDVHFGDDHDWVSGSLGVSTWLLTVTTRSGEQIEV